jgi:deazaflavin-dependent oxidoreductase (nitroreductase family)
MYRPMGWEVMMSTMPHVNQSKRLNPVRQFNRRVLNHFTLTFAGRRIYAVVQHVGRRSGKTYNTPVVAASVGDEFIMPLPYGSDTDWCMNVMAADGCTLQHKGKAYHVNAPKIMNAAEALPLLQPYWRFMFRLFHVELFLRVKPAALSKI